MHTTCEADQAAVKVRAWASRFDDLKSSLGRVVLGHEFNSAVEVLVGACSAIPFTAQLLAAMRFWRGEETPAALLNGAVFDGFSVVSEGVDAQTEDVVQRENSGTLTVQACRETHLTLGLDGRKQPHDQLWRSSVTRADKRTLAALNRLPRFRFMAVHNDPSKTLPWTPESPLPVSSRLPQTQMPSFSFAADARREEMETALSWVGAVLAGAAWPAPGSTPNVSPAAAEVGVVKWAGMASSHSISHVVEALRKMCRDKEVPWAAVVVRGFDQDVVHSGENNYCLFIQPGGDEYWAFVMAKTLPL